MDEVEEMETSNVEEVEKEEPPIEKKTEEETKTDELQEEEEVNSTNVKKGDEEEEEIVEGDLILEKSKDAECDETNSQTNDDEELKKDEEKQVVEGEIVENEADEKIEEVEKMEVENTILKNEEESLQNKEGEEKNEEEACINEMNTNKASEVSGVEQLGNVDLLTEIEAVFEDNNKEKEDSVVMEKLEIEDVQMAEEPEPEAEDSSKNLQEIIEENANSFEEIAQEDTTNLDELIEEKCKEIVPAVVAEAETGEEEKGEQKEPSSLQEITADNTEKQEEEEKEKPCEEELVKEVKEPSSATTTTTTTTSNLEELLIIKPRKQELIARKISDEDDIKFQDADEDVSGEKTATQTQQIDEDMEIDAELTGELINNKKDASATENKESDEKFKSIEDMLSEMDNLCEKNPNPSSSSSSSLNTNAANVSSNKDVKEEMSSSDLFATLSATRKEESPKKLSIDTGILIRQLNKGLKRKIEQEEKIVLNAKNAEKIRQLMVREQEQVPAPTPPKRGRGRPRKNPLPDSIPKAIIPIGEKRGRGRPSLDMDIKKKMMLKKQLLERHENETSASNTNTNEEDLDSDSSNSRPLRNRKLNPKYSNYVSNFKDDEDDDIINEKIASKFKLVDINRILNGKDNEVSSLFSPKVVERLRKLKSAKNDDLTYEDVLKHLRDEKAKEKDALADLLSKSGIVPSDEDESEESSPTYALFFQSPQVKPRREDRDKIRPRFVAFKRIVKNIKQVKLPSKDWQVKLGLSESNKVIQVTCTDVVNKKNVQLSCFKRGYEIIFDGRYLRLLGAPDAIDTLHDLSILLSIVNGININDPLLELKT